MSERTSRRKTGRQIGEPSEDDDPARRLGRDTISSTSLSTRTLPEKHVLSLTTYCARAFAAHFRKLATREETWPRTKSWLDQLPDQMMPTLLVMLSDSCPDLLTHGVIAQHFLRGSSITLTSALPGVIKPTLAAVSRDANHLQHLRLTGFEKFPDIDFAAVVKKLPKLQTLNLRGCSKVSVKTVKAIADRCTDLVTLNLSFTAATPMSMSEVIQNCRQLQSLKLAGIPNWTDATFAKLLTVLNPNNEQFSLPNIQQLKFQQTALTDTSILPLLEACPNLKKLDVGFTGVRHAYMPKDAPIHPMEKLVLTSTAIPAAELVEALKPLKKLRVLHLAAMGGGQGTAARIGNSTAMTLSDAFLEEITDVLSNAEDLETVSLVGNTKLGLARRDGALADFITRVGRRCKRLHLSGIRQLRSTDFEGLIADDPQMAPPNLEVLTIDNTNVGDEAVPFLSACKSLRTLSAGGTKFTSDGLFPLIDACTELEQMDLTGCRGVNVVDRRRFFEVWEQRKLENDE